MISFLMPVQDEADYIEDALASIVACGCALEVLVVDDGSQDATVRVVEALNLPQVRLIRTDGIGKAAAFNLAYREARGDFFILIAGDDCIAPTVVAARVAPLRAVAAEVPAISLCKLQSFSAQRRYHGMVLPRHPARGLESGGCMAFNRAFGELAFPIPTALANEDSWLVLHARFSPIEIFQVPQVGIFYRIHAGNSYRRGAPFAVVNGQMWARQKAAFYFLEQHGAALGDRQRRTLLAELAVHLLRYMGAWGVLMLVPGASLGRRFKALAHARPALYALRERFYKFFSGR